MATAGTAQRQPAERYLSDEDVSSRVTQFAFKAEALEEQPHLCSSAENATDARNLARDIEALANLTAAQRPSTARRLRTAAADLRRAADTETPRDFAEAVYDARFLLETL